MHLLSNARAVFAGLAVTALAATGIALGAAPANAASVGTWDDLAQCESSGNWHINTGNGYYGGLQFSMGTWRAHGGSGNPAAASKSTQIQIAERVLKSQGWGAWPACSAKLGLRGGASSVSSDHVAKKKVKHSKVKTSGKTYVVRSGDTLSTIAAKRHVKGGWHRLWAANPKVKNPSVIHVGQRLALPA